MPTENVPQTKADASPANCGGATGCGSETRQAILEAARTRFLHYGYKKTTIDDIAQTAGVGKGTVYLYFENKEDILLTIAKQVKHNITEQMRAITQSLAPPDEKVRRMVLAKVLSVHDACQTAQHGIELVDEMLQPRIMRCGVDEHQKQAALIAQVLDEGVRTGTIALPCPSEKAAEFITLAVVSFFPPYLNPCHAHTGCRFDLQDRVNAMMDFLLWGMRQQASRSR